MKHNWQRSKSTELFLKFKTFFSFQDNLIKVQFACDQCVHKFESLDSLKKHEETTHKENSVFEREEKNGEVKEDDFQQKGEVSRK